MTEPPQEPLAESLDARAAARRADGTYPPDIDATLEREVADRLRTAATHTTALRAAIAQLHAVGPFELPTYHGSKRLKAFYARVVEKAIGHALADLVRQLETYRTAVERVLEELPEVAEPPSDDPAR